MATTELPDDILLAIFSYLELSDIPSLRLVNKKILRLSHAGGLWKRFLHTCVARNSLPIPGLHNAALDTLEGCEIEAMLRRAVELQMNWTSPNPIPKQAIDFPSTSATGTVRFLQFIRRSGCLWMLSATFHEQVPDQRKVTMECWSIPIISSSTPPTCIAHKTLENFTSIAVNEQSSTAETAGDLAILLDSLIIVYSIRPNSECPDDGFAPISRFPGRRTVKLHLFSGTRMVTTDEDEVGEHVVAWDIRHPKVSIELRNPRVDTEIPRTIRASASYGEPIVLVTSTTCEVYSLPSPDSTTASSASTVLEPLDQWKWPWDVASAILAISPSSTVGRDVVTNPTLPPTISILIRFSSGHFWPVNLLHQYEVVANVAADSGTTGCQYLLPPTLRQTIASPLRWLAHSEMDIGPYGTSIWIDSHTEDYFGHHHPAQRLAARVMVPTTVNDEDISEEEEDVGDDDAAGDNITSTEDVSILHWNENDTWTEVAVNEEEGIVALGHTSGRFTLLSYT